MGDRVTASGLVEAAPRVVVTTEGLTVASFLLRTRIEADRRVRLPPDASPGCYLVTVVDDLARSVGTAVSAGDRIVVSGLLVLRELPGDALGSGVVLAELHAEAIGLHVTPGPSTRSDRAAHRPGLRAILS